MAYPTAVSENTSELPLTGKQLPVNIYDAR